MGLTKTSVGPFEIEQTERWDTGKRGIYVTITNTDTGAVKELFPMGTENDDRAREAFRAALVTLKFTSSFCPEMP